MEELLEIPHLHADEGILVRAGARDGTSAPQIARPLSATAVEPASPFSRNPIRIQATQPVHDRGEVTSRWVVEFLDTGDVSEWF